MLRRAYGAEFCDNLATMTPKMVDDRLRELGTTDATHRKALSFFVNTAKEAELSMSSAVAKRARKRPLGAGAKHRQKSKTLSKSSEAGPSGSDDGEGPSPRSMDTLKIQYIEMLMGKAEDLGDGELYDRIEKLLGFQEDNDGDG